METQSNNFTSTSNIVNPETGENVLDLQRNILICGDQTSLYEDFDYVKNNFCGKVFTDIHTFNSDILSSNTYIYLVGIDVEQFYLQVDLDKFIKISKVYVVNDFTSEFINNTDSKSYEIINIQAIPINIHGMGVYFRNFVNSSKLDYFETIKMEHQFQTLTESNKESNAFRKGIYLSRVEEKPETNNLTFNLLRCSTNLDGPTESFSQTDQTIIDLTNNLATQFYSETKLNHVLAQIYTNTQVGTKEKKARIKAHSDKTKDMDRCGLIAFCSFYENYSNNKFNGKHEKIICKSEDCVIESKNSKVCQANSVLSRLRFKLKFYDSKYPKQFDVVLYPNSVFIIPLSTNRLYTHEIIPSILPVDKIPTRMGYVVRCSDTKAIYKKLNSSTFIIHNNVETQLVKQDLESFGSIEKLKELYYKENMFDQIVEYPETNFSLNLGDYMEPRII